MRSPGTSFTERAFAFMTSFSALVPALPRPPVAAGSVSLLFGGVVLVAWALTLSDLLPMTDVLLPVSWRLLLTPAASIAAPVWAEPVLALPSVRSPVPDVPAAVELLPDTAWPMAGELAEL